MGRRQLVFRPGDTRQKFERFGCLPAQAFSRERAAEPEKREIRIRVSLERCRKWLCVSLPLRRPAWDRPISGKVSGPGGSTLPATRQTLAQEVKITHPFPHPPPARWSGAGREYFLPG